VSAASGLKFVQDAPTDEMPSPRREAYQPQRYGDRWAPLLVAVAPIGDSSTTNSSTVVDSSVDVAKLDGAEWIVSGAITLDGDGMERLSSDALQLRVLRHAIGHVVGLDDVAAAGEVMHPGSTGERGFASGDRRGLARLGAIPCPGS